MTAVGCLYLIDTSNSTETSKGRKAALDADGVWLMLINVAFIFWMVGLIITAGRHEVKKTVLSIMSWLTDKLSQSASAEAVEVLVDGVVDVMGET